MSRTLLLILVFFTVSCSTTNGIPKIMLGAESVEVVRFFSVNENCQYLGEVKGVKTNLFLLYPSVKKLSVEERKDLRNSLYYRASTRNSLINEAYKKGGNLVHITYLQKHEERGDLYNCNYLPKNKYTKKDSKRICVE